MAQYKNITIDDETFILEDDGDPTKKAEFELSGITTGTTRVFTFPDSDGTLVTTATATGNTLDEAYDEGGAGAGRSITVDSGAVQLTHSSTNDAFNISGTNVDASSIVIDATYQLSAFGNINLATIGATNAPLALSGAENSGADVGGNLLLASKTSPLSTTLSTADYSDTTATLPITVQTGSQSGTSGDSGAITIQTGTSANGARGDITIAAKDIAITPDAGGGVGIGSVSGNAKLLVQTADADIGLKVLRSASGGASEPIALFEGTNSSDGQPVVKITSNSTFANRIEIDTNKFVVDKDGDVGIGVASPSGKLDIGVANADNVVALEINQLDVTNNPAAISIINTGSGNDVTATNWSVTKAGAITAASFVGPLTGNADTVTTNANLTGDVTSVGNATTIAAKAVDVAMLADGTDGELITWDATGVATTVATGTSGQVLTSNGAGAAPTFQAASASISVSTGNATRAATTGTTNSAHGLGATPSVVMVSWFQQGNVYNLAYVQHGSQTWTSAGTSGVQRGQSNRTSGTQNPDNSWNTGNTNTGNTTTFALTADGTNVTVTATQNGSGGEGVTYHWTAFA